MSNKKVMTMMMKMLKNRCPARLMSRGGRSKLYATYLPSSCTS